MSLLLPQELIEHLAPTVCQLFKIDKNQVITELKDFSPILEKFITDPAKQYILIQQTDHLVVVHALENTGGPVLFCNKSSEKLYKSNYLATLTVLPISSEALLSVMHSIVGRLFLPLLQNSTNDEDSLQVDLYNNLSVSNISMNRCRSNTKFPEPVLDIEEKYFQIGDSNQLTPEQESLILTSIENWELNVDSILRDSQNQTFDNIQEELSFWPLISSRIEQIIQQSEKLSNSTLPDFIKNHRKKFPSNLIKIKTEANGLYEIIYPFSVCLSEFEYNIFDNITDLDQLNEVIVRSTEFLSDRILGESLFDFRSLQLFSLLNKEIMKNLLKVISKSDLLRKNIDDFQLIAMNTHEIIKIWNEQNKIIIDKLNSSKYMHELKEENMDLENKGKSITRFMKQLKDSKEHYHNFLDTLNKHPEVATNDMKLKLQSAFEKLSDNITFELTKEGIHKRNVVIYEYNQAVESVESQVAQVISTMISNIKDLFEMQEIFVQYKELIRQPTIQSYLRKNQFDFVSLIEGQIDILKKDLINISKQNIYTYLYQKGTTTDGARLIIIKRIEARLNRFKQMLVDVVGDNWENANICQTLSINVHKIESDIAKENDSSKFITMFHNKPETLNQSLFTIEKRNGKPSLSCKYSQTIANTLNTYRTAKQLGLSFDQAAAENIEVMLKNYNKYIQLNEAIIMWNSIIEVIDQDTIAFSADYLSEIYNYLESGWKKQWNAPDLDDFIKGFAQSVVVFKTNLAKYRRINESIDSFIKKISQSEDSQQIKEYLGEILALVDQLFTSTKFQNRDLYCENIRKQISELLKVKIEKTFTIWDEKLANNQMLPNVESIVIKLSLSSSNQITFSPHYDQIHPILNRMFTETMNNFIPQIDFLTFDDIVQTKPVDIIYNHLEKLSSTVSKAVNQWRNFQFFFSNEPGMINYENSIQNWTTFLSNLVSVYQNVKKMNPKENFGVVAIDSTKLQPLIVERLAEWHKEIAKNLRKHAREIIKDISMEIKGSKDVIENSKTSNAKEIAQFLRKFKDAGKNLAEYQALIPYLDETTKYCRIEEYQPFKTNFLDFIALYNKRKDEIDTNRQSICATVDSETDTMKNNVKVLQMQWEKVRPIKGSIVPEKALKGLSTFETAFSKLKSQWEELSAARESIGLQVVVPAELDGMIGDLKEIKNVWNNLATIYGKLQSLFAVSFSTFVPQEFKSKIIGLNEKMQAMEQNVKNYEPWEYYQDNLKKILKIYPILEGLKSPAIITRHWSLIGQKFNKTIDIEKITLQEIYDFDLEKNQEFIAEITRNAQGEFSLHQYLEKLNTSWNTLEFEFSNYNENIQIIKSWDVIMSTISDHLNFLGTMQTSPFFNVFREQATSWTTKLNQLQVSLDDWLDVQRRFIYLEGVFNSSDIRQILAKATTSFKRNEKEFIKLTKQAQQLKIVIQILTIPNIDVTLQTLNDNFLQLQKELSDYLEKQRSYFPRFFFIGDEDLLEIIGKSSQINEIQKHFSKMFEGLHQVKTENKQITQISCNEGETVDLLTPVSIENAVYKMLLDLENEMKISLSSQLFNSLQIFKDIWKNNMNIENLKSFIESNPAQIVLLCFCIVTTMITEEKIQQNENKSIAEEIIKFISLLSQLVFTDLSNIARHTVQQIITEAVHQRNLSRKLSEVKSTDDFNWTRYLRFYATNNSQVEAKIGDASFLYGFEYLGMCPFLVRTPLTDKVYLTLAQALHAKLGGSPFGPAGTGKTETVKNMGHHLGRHVLVFNCDETFDFKAMGRIFVGLCQCGSWGCFDEFNRLDEQMLSAVSQQIQTIQVGLKSGLSTIEILGKQTTIKENIGIFITMNPGYAGRVELPDNLKQLFRTMAMNKPDTELITEVLLFSQGFSSAEVLAPKFVTLFQMAKEALTNQTHYDFGLRAMKYVLANAGQLIRINNTNNLSQEIESKLLISSIVNTLYPKLLTQDLIKLKQLINDVFPGVTPEDINQELLINSLKEESEKMGWICSDVWLNKIIQLYYIQQINHGFMLVGPSGTGKTSARTVLLKVLSLLENKESECYVINPKSVSKETLFGTLDSVTREWTDGVFTRILRTIVNDQRGEMSKRHWIVFDGDVDPEWVENLNSVLDDNKLLTLPNGERISLPPNVRVVFEVANLNFATPATVSRCGIVFFSQNTLTNNKIIHYYISQLQKDVIIKQDHILHSEFMDIAIPDMLNLQNEFTNIVKPLISQTISVCEQFYQKYQTKSVMEIPLSSLISTFFSLIKSAFVLCFRQSNNDVLLQQSVIYSAFWAFALPFTNEIRKDLDNLLHNQFSGYCPRGSLLTNYLSFETRDFVSVESQNLPKILEDFVPTSQNEVEKQVINLSFIGGRPLVLTGHSGIGKRSIYKSALQNYADIETINVNLSNVSSIDFLLRTFEQFCVYIKTSSSIKMKPKKSNTFLVFICNDMNLPNLDKYGTQRVVEFLRQILESNGFWHPIKREWIQLELISLVGVCCLPTEYGRVKLSERFLRHAAVFYINHPSKEETQTIISNLIDSKEVPEKESTSKTICEFYFDYKDHFRASEIIHYNVNMRDIISWLNSYIYAFNNNAMIDPSHVLYYEGLRIFSDRLEKSDEKETVKQLLQSTIIKNFSSTNNDLFDKDVVYTRLMDGHYKPFSKEEILEKLVKKMKEFCDENSSNEMIYFGEAIDEFVRIERRLLEPGGHQLLVGLSGTGKISMTNFVSWCFELPVFRLRIHREYTINDLDQDLRRVLKKCLETSVCLIVKDTDLILPIFTERLNVLLTESSIPGLYQGDELQSLIASVKDVARINGQMVENDDDVYNYFVDKVRNNLHIIFTSNSSKIDMNLKSIQFPSLFATCNINWIGAWSNDSLKYFANKIIKQNELKTDENIIETLIKIHQDSVDISSSLQNTNYVSPRYFFEFIEQYCKIYKEKSKNIQTDKEHLSKGLQKLKETQSEVKRMGVELEKKKVILKESEVKAEQKLEEIIKDKETTKQKQTEAEKIKVQLDEKTAIINKDKSSAQAELDAIAPLIAEAANSVQNIKKSNLDEIRRFKQPPDVVKNTLAAVLTLLGNRTTDWSSIQKSISESTFIKSVVDFKVDASQATAIKRAKQMISATDLTYEKADRASKACGPLFKWLDANLRYLDIVEQTEPLRNRVSALEEEANELQKKHDEMSQTIRLLEKSLRRITLEYQQLTSQCDTYRKEAEQVQIKLDRAQHLLESLTSETQRWNERNVTFQSDFDNLIGHSILSSAFVSYCGYLDQQHRIDSMYRWMSILSENGIKYNEEFNFVNFMANPNKLIEWSKKELPQDDLCIQNAIVLDSQSTRIPFIVDPAGQATQFILNTFDKIIKTSFVDSKFPKHLESCLRFGTTLLIEDGEQMDQLILPVLSHEFRKVGGRILMDLKRNEIDISSSFKLFIVTRDTDFNPNPSIASLTNLINFSVTSLSLKAQCLTRLLQVKLPDIESRRQELHQSLSTMQVSLSKLENDMLDVFSKTKGEILEDDNLLHLLEDIKNESISIEQKANETRKTLQEIGKTSEQFSPVAEVATSLYLALRDMCSVHFLYQFSLNFFWRVFDKVIDSNIPPELLIDQMTKELFIQVSYSLLNRHVTVFGFRFSQILLEHKGINVDDSLYNIALRGTNVGGKEPSFLSSINDPIFTKWLAKDSPETEIPQEVLSVLGTSDHKAVTSLKVLAIIRRQRQDRIVAACNMFIRNAFDYDILDTPPLDISQTAKNLPPTTPLLLVSAAGHDPSEKVEAEAAKETGQKVVSVAVGAPDTYSNIEKAVQQAAAKGNWVIVKNVHLAPFWVRTFVKNVQQMNPSNGFRLFMTSEINPKVGSNTFRACRVIVFEPATGIRANLKRLSNFQWPESPHKQLVINFLWLHAVIVERLRFAPLGWSKIYEFNTSDLNFATQVGFRWLSKTETIPWESLKFLVSMCAYGGRVDVSSDSRSLQNLANLILKDGAEIYGNPTCKSQEEFKNWVDSLPADESPEVLYLPRASGKFLFVQLGNETIQSILSAMAGQVSRSMKEKQSLFIKALLDQLKEKLESSPLSDSSQLSNQDNLIATAISDEINFLKETREQILSDVNEIIETLQNGDCLTQKHQKIIETLNRGDIPQEWNPHQFKCLDFGTWIDDFIARINQLNLCASDKNMCKNKLRAGLFKSPETLVAAAKQTASRVNKWPIEKMVMKLVVQPKKMNPSYDICFIGLSLLSASWGDGCLSAADEVVNKLPPTVVTWELENEREKMTNPITVPFFMTQSKKRILFEAELEADQSHSQSRWAVRNPSIVVQKDGL
ncbi:dynein heavy chain family protein family [Trichomonas vaginalis G3]|uniref:dynein heavy chain family protein family n=1 Tax=Trichomonas vaginalis (strain ATCC PRA-98 / G3) TaxID=412133 RepID=UPI0021E62520|nr:dynein heavy chain family protein family [Trichomonas vaginalis G3]KAI5541278.1 dynein heavy chain family protein family [Trichomonas vaginalis G3]